MLMCCLLLCTVDESTDTVHTLCEVPRQKARRQELLLSAMYSKSKKLEPPTRTARTRNDDKNNFSLIKPKLEGYKKGPFYRGAQLWNSLSLEEQFSNDKVSFKLKMKKKLGTNLKGARNRLLNARRKGKAKGPAQPNMLYHIFPVKKKQQGNQ